MNFRDVILTLGLICLSANTVIAKSPFPDWKKIPKFSPSVSLKDTLKKPLYLGTPHEFSGNGTYEVASGDTVHLDNGVSIQIKQVNSFKSPYLQSLNGRQIFANFFIKGKKLNPAPVFIQLVAIPPIATWQGYEFRGYGVSIVLPTGNSIQQAPVSFELKSFQQRYGLTFTSPEKVGTVTSAVDLFNHCLALEAPNLPEEVRYLHCLYLIPYEPLPSEMKTVGGGISLIGPTDASEAVTAFFQEATACYDFIKEKLKMEPLFLPVPIRLVGGKKMGAAITSPDFGILLPFNPNTSPPVPDGSCQQTMLLHELVHYFVAPAPIRSVYNEGLATLLQHSIEKLLPVKMITANLEVPQTPVTIPGTGLLFKLALPVDASVPTDQATFQYGFLSQGIFQPFDKPIKAKEDKTTTAPYDNFVPLIQLKEIHHDTPSATVALYSHAQLLPGLKCNNQGYQNAIGWTTDQGTTLAADETINPSELFMPLANYLTPGYDQNILPFYNTAACLWQGIGEQIGLEAVMKEMKKYQNFKNLPFPFFDFLSAQGIDVATLKQKFGIKPDEPNAPSYIPLMGNVGQY